MYCTIRRTLGKSAVDCNLRVSFVTAVGVWQPVKWINHGVDRPRTEKCGSCPAAAAAISSRAGWKRIWRFVVVGGVGGAVVWCGGLHRCASQLAGGSAATPLPQKDESLERVMQSGRRPICWRRARLAERCKKSSLTASSRSARGNYCPVGVCTLPHAARRADVVNAGSARLNRTPSYSPHLFHPRLSKPTFVNSFYTHKTQTIFFVAFINIRLPEYMVAQKQNPAEMSINPIIPYMLPMRLDFSSKLSVNVYEKH